MTDILSGSISTLKANRILRLPEVMGRVGLRRASIYLHINKGSLPKPISLGARRGLVGKRYRRLDCRPH